VQLSEMRDYVRNVVDIDSTDIADTTLNTFIREGYNAVVYSEKRWPFYETTTTFSTVADTKDYTLATVGASVAVTHDSSSISVGLREIASLKTDDHVIEFLGYDDGDLMYPLDTNTTGDPWYWSYWQDTVRFHPTPSAVTTIYVRGYRNAVDFGGNTAVYRPSIADTNTTDLPDPFNQVLASYAIYRSYQQQEDGGMASQYYAQFVSELDNLRARYEDSPAPQPLILNHRNTSKWRASLPYRLRYTWE